MNRTFTYQARDDAGRLVRGTLEAESQAALVERLRRMGYLVTRMKEARGPASREILKFRLGKGFSQEQLLLAVVQLANLVEAGLPVVSVLRTTAGQLSPGPLRQALQGSAAEIEAGSSLSETLRRRPEVFPPLLAQMVSVGEASGKLDLVLARFAEFLEKDLAFRRDLQAALTYPVLLLAASLALVLFVVAFLVPQFTAFFAKAGLPLPGPTRFLSAAGLAVRHSAWLWLMLAFLACMGGGYLLRIPTLQEPMDAALLRLPALGALIHETVVARFARNLATLLASGIPVLQALETARGVVGNRRMAGEISRVRSSVERGERIADSLGVGGLFRPDLVQMVRAGEASGRLDGMLEKVADLYDRRVRFSLRQLMILLEPALLVAMGGVVALIMASLLLPMFDLVKVLQRGGFR